MNPQGRILEGTVQGLLVLFGIAALLTGCNHDKWNMANLLPASEADAPEIVYHDGPAIGVEYVNGHEKEAMDVLVKECAGNYRILNRSERENTTIVDALCPR